MLLEDQMEPLCREISHFLVSTGAMPSGSWAGYDRNRDFLPYRRDRDDEWQYSPAGMGQARFVGRNFKEGVPDPDSIKVHPAIVLSQSEKATASVKIDNLKGTRPSEPFEWTKSFKSGESELHAFETAFEHEQKTTATAKAGLEGVAEAEVATEVRDFFRAAYSLQTGVTKESESGGKFALVADPGAYVEGFLRWMEQDLQRRIEMDAIVDFAFSIGRRWKKGSWRWASGRLDFDSIEHLIAVAEKRGSPSMPCYHHFSRMNLNEAQRDSLDRIKKLRRQKIDKLTPVFKGAEAFKIVISNLETNEEMQGE